MTPPLVLLHAFPLDSRLFDAVRTRLADRVWLLSPDLRGFGAGAELTNPPPAPDLDLLADDVHTLLDAEGIGQAIIGGVSMGGYIAMALLAEDPGRVQALILSDTQHTADDEAGKQKREETAAAIERDGMEHVVRTLLPKLIADSSPEEVRTKLEQLIRANPPKGAAAATRGMALRPDSRDILARFGGPALVVVGDQDTVTPVEKARKLAELISGSKLEVIEGAGHLPNLEQPEKFNAVLERFLSSLPSP